MRYLQVGLCKVLHGEVPHKHQTLLPSGSVSPGQVMAFEVLRVDGISSKTAYKQGDNCRSGLAVIAISSSSASTACFIA